MPRFSFLCVAVPLGELLADELACGARRTAVAAQRKALSEQVQLVPLERKTALVGELLDDVQIFVLVRNGEGDLETEAVGQGGDGFERVANADVVTLTVGHAFADEVAAVGGRVDDKVGRLAGETALDERLEGREIVVLTVKGQVVEEYNKAERRAERLLKQFGEAGDMARRHLDDLEAAVGVLVGDRLDGRGFAGALVAVEQDVVRVLAVEEGAGILEHLLFLAFVARQVMQADGVGMDDRERRAVVLHGERRGLREKAVALAPVVAGKLRAGGERKRGGRREIGKRTQRIRIKMQSCRLAQLTAGESEQAVQHLDVVGRGGKQRIRRGVDRVGQRVDIKVDRVQKEAGNIAAGEACRAQRTVAVREIGRRAVKGGKRLGVCVHEREPEYAAQNGKRVQTQRKVGKLHG